MTESVIAGIDIAIDKVQILAASLGSESGVCGALILARRALKESNR
ncbi:MAG: hypothetical protein IPK58_13825 [Acidobacteria bacterium]|nr:hypothetical protein [Acidobacteriota bacterium]